MSSHRRPSSATSSRSEATISVRSRRMTTSRSYLASAGPFDQQIQIVGLGDGLGPVAGAQLAEQAALQVLHCLYGDAEGPGRLLDRLAPLDGLEDVDLPRRQGDHLAVVEAHPGR